MLFKELFFFSMSVMFKMPELYIFSSFLIYSGALKLRVRRAAQRVCKLGTCQLNNLANMLYHIGQTHGKDQSKGAHDPQGYGR